MKIEDKDLEEYISNIQQINYLLERNEQIVKNAGYKPPTNNFSVNKNDRIKIPRGYIRTSGEFWRKYHLTEIVIEKNIRNNISYALQLSDYFNYLINRFDLWGSIETMLYKQAFVNVVSIMESLVLEVASNINKNCKNCRKIGKCANNITKDDRSNMKKAVYKLSDIGILNFNDEEINEIIEIYDCRNKIHIRLNNHNEFLDNKYNREFYNKSIVYLKKIDQKLWENGIAYYKHCIGYKEKI